MKIIRPQDTLASLTRPWEILLIHHTHTDIGFTEHPKKVERYHVQFLEDVVDIWRDVQSGKSPEMAGFRWTVETFWTAERFLESTSGAYRQDFEAAVRAGFIGLTATYLHNSELGDQELLRRQVRRPIAYGENLGVPVRSAFSADINGVGWGYAGALADNRVENYFTCLHAHKGAQIGHSRQRPFYWETVDGRRILVWFGEQYHIGNLMGLAPQAALTWMMSDELSAFPAMTGQKELSMARTGRYLKRLEQDGYPYGFIPMTISGMATDNSPPSREILRFASEWNQEFGSSVRLTMVTLEEFFARLKPVLGPEVPVWSGDWPDWWTDGVASVPRATRIFRSAQRQWCALEKAVAENQAVTDPALLLETENALNMFAEHTNGHSDIVTYPWDIQVQATFGAKEVHAQRAFASILSAWDQALGKRGAVRQAFDRPSTYRVWNASPVAADGIAEIYLEYPEFGQIERQARVIDVATGNELVHQQGPACRGIYLFITLRLGAWEERFLRIEPAPQTLITSERQLERQVLQPDAEGTEAELETSMKVTATGLRSPWVDIAWAQGVGINKWIDVATGRNLLRSDADHSPFALVIQRTSPATPNDAAQEGSTRAALGRNRIGPTGQRFVSRLISATPLEKGPVFCTVQLDYEIEHLQMCRVVLKAFKDLPRVDVSVRLLKNPTWDAETLYLSLPFTAGEGSELWLDKSGALMRPRVDQLPNSLTDYYAVQAGWVWVSNGNGVAVASPDSPLVQVGPLEYGIRKLHGHPRLSEEKEHVYSWIINTCWETNFEINTGGFHEFRYSIFSGVPFAKTDHAIKTCRSANIGFQTYRAEIPEQSIIEKNLQKA